MTACRVLDLFQGVRLTPTQRRIAHSLVQHAADGGLPVRGRGGRAGRGEPAVGDPVRDGAGLRRLSGAAPASCASSPTAPARAGDRTASNADAAGGARRRPSTCDRLADQLGRPRRASRAAGRLLAASRPLPVLGLRAAAPLAGVLRLLRRQGASRTCGCSTPAAAMLLDRLDQARAAGATAPCWRSCCPAIRGRRWTRPRGPARRAAPSWRSPTRRSARPPSTPTWCCPRRSAPSSCSTCTPAPMAMAMVLLQAMCDADAGADAQRRLEEFEASAARRHDLRSAEGESDDVEISARRAAPRAPRRAGRRRPPCGC